MEPKFYKIRHGNLVGHSICEKCSAVLLNNLEYHNCHTYPNIQQWYTSVLESLKCPFSICKDSAKFSTVSGFMDHQLDQHQTVIIYTCQDCDIAFGTLPGVYFHKKLLEILKNRSSCTWQWTIYMYHTQMLHSTSITCTGHVFQDKYSIIKDWSRLTNGGSPAESRTYYCTRNWRDRTPRS